MLEYYVFNYEKKRTTSFVFYSMSAVLLITDHLWLTDMFFSCIFIQAFTFFAVGKFFQFVAAANGNW